jgi:hypothetical protein
MKTKILVLVVALIAAAALHPAYAGDILQPADGSALAFEADIGVANIVNTNDTTKVFWSSIPDANASGGTALYANTSNNVPPFTGGINGSGGPQFNRPNSFVTYSLGFSQAGTYYVYYRWRADEAVVTANSDASQANSFWFGNAFGEFITPGDTTSFLTAAANGVSSPSSLAWQWQAETAPFTVDMPGTYVFTICDREWGVILDRIVFSAEVGLTGAQLDATPNSLTDVIPQNPGDSYIAFEADRLAGAGAAYDNTNDMSKVFWSSIPDANASGGTALYANTSNNVPPFTGGINGSGGPQFNRPNSFVAYSLGFNQAGTYYVYYRWRADESVITANSDASQANSFWFGNAFGEFITPGDTTSFLTAAANGVSSPSSLAWQWQAESTPFTVDNPGTNVFTICDREWGVLLDRIVFSTDPALTGAQLDGLANSGGLASAPTIKQASGAWGNQAAVITFSDNVNSASVVPGNFTINGGVTVSAASVGPGANQVTLTTSAQTQAAVLSITINNVTSAVTGLPVSPGSTVNFTAWQLANGWSLEQIYFAIGSSALDIATLPSYINQTPNAVIWVKGFQNDHYPDGLFSAQINTIFTPTSSGDYSFYGNADDDASLFYSTDVSAAVLGNYANLPNLMNLISFGNFGAAVGPVPPFAVDGYFPQTVTLTAGTPYTLEGLLRQNQNDAYFKIALDSSTSATPPEQLPVLGGNRIQAWVDPSQGNVTFTQQPSPTSAPSGSRAKFTVKATSAQSPLYYQWRSNGVDIVGANRATYITPLLSASYNGAVYSVVVSVAGKDTPSAGAGLTVTAGGQPALVPYLGINFAGHDFQHVPGALTPYDVAGVVPQANWNNLYNFFFDTAPGTGGDLVDAQGLTNGVTLYCSGTGNSIGGTKAVGSADSILFQGYMHGSSNVLDFTISGVTNGTYNVLVYSIGFSFNATYQERFDLTSSSGATYPTYYGQGQVGPTYVQNPNFVRMTSTTPGNYTPGNYVQFDNVKVTAGDVLELIIAPESPQAEGNLLPAISAIQLIQVMPALAITRNGGNINIAWSDAAAGFLLESRAGLTTGTWSVVPSAPNPIAVAGSINVPATGPSTFYRLRKP